MDFANQFILAIGLLLLLSILASRATDRLGAPLLLVFLVIGMLAGEDGPGGIEYNDFASAHLLSSLALAVILFDGGLRTRFASFRTGLRPAVVLATLGVIVTAVITGTAAMWIFDVRWVDGLLIGAIVGSTDAAAVFYLLRAHGLHVNERVHSTLEIESGANDPMAVFLTLTLIEFVAGRQQELGLQLLLDFGWQMGLGGVVGIGGGLLLAGLVNRLSLEDSLFPLLALGGGIAVYGLAASLDGSGFLAAYVAGLLVGNRVRRAANTIRRFHDGMAWLSQIGLFLLLGLLVTPAELVPMLPGGLLTALVLVLVARPVAVFLSLWPFRFSLREQLFISWVGLRGAVPIVLGLYPLLSGIDYALADFNIAFCVVLVSLVLQGWTVAPVARWLGVQLPPAAKGGRVAEFDAPAAPGKEVVIYRVMPMSFAETRLAEQLPLPATAQLLAVVRNGVVVPPSGQALAADDQVYIVVPHEDAEAMEELFGGMTVSSARRKHLFFGDFVLPADSKLGDLAEVYAIGTLPRGEQPDETLAELFEHRYGRRTVIGDSIRVGNLTLTARRVEAGRVVEVGLKIPHRR
jgi:cell volume regulation protein A